MNKTEKEPIVHSLISDCLPENHPLAHEEVFCDTCNEMVHCFNNECMRMWFECNDRFNGKINYCLECFYTNGKQM